MAYEQCADVSQEIWKELEERDPAEVTGRTGVIFQDGMYRLPFLERELLLDPARQGARSGYTRRRRVIRGSGPACRLSATCCIWTPRPWGPASAPWPCRAGPPSFGATTACPTLRWRPGSARIWPALWPPAGNSRRRPGRRGCRPGLAGLSRADGGGDLVAGG